MIWLFKCNDVLLRDKLEVNEHYLFDEDDIDFDESKTEYKTLDSNTIRINKASTYLIVDDNGQPTWYNDDVLIPLEKYRDLKLKDLLGN